MGTVLILISSRQSIDQLWGLIRLRQLSTVIISAVGNYRERNTEEN